MTTLTTPEMQTEMERVVTDAPCLRLPNNELNRRGGCWGGYAKHPECAMRAIVAWLRGES